MAKPRKVSFKPGLIRCHWMVPLRETPGSIPAHARRHDRKGALSARLARDLEFFIGRM